MLSLPSHLHLADPSSPIQKKKRQPLLRCNRIAEDDAAPLLSPRTCRSADSWFSLEKTVLADSDHGLSLTSDPTYGGIIVSCIDRTSLAAINGLLVGDDIRAIDGTSLSSTEQALGLLNASDRKGRIITASGETREVRLDKSKGPAVGLTIGASPSTRGVRLVEIAPGSLAEAAGLRVGDTILAVNEALIDSHEQAVARMNAIAREVRLVVVAQSEQAPPPVGIRPGCSLRYVTAEFGQGPYGMTVRGMNVDNIVMVKEVVSDGSAARQGIEPGSVLLKVGDVKVDGLEYEAVVQELKTAARPVRILLSVPV